MTRAAYQGAPGSYGECAALQLGYRPVPCASFAEAANAVECGDADVALLPVENSTEGSVGGSNDILFDTGLHITGESYYRVRHCLIGFGDEDGVRTVYSHQQALGQCRRFIGNRRTVSVYDTAGAVGMIRDINRADVAAIASREAAAIYKVPVIAEDINDVSENYTRFLTVGRAPVARIDGQAESKTAVAFMLKHEPGALCAALLPLRGLNMTRIESRPRKNGSFEYNFCADFMGHADDAGVRSALEELGRRVVSLRVLGSYPSGLADAPRTAQSRSHDNG